MADVGDNLEEEPVVSLEGKWNEAVQEINNIDPQSENWKAQSLPLARIKKIMKCEEFTLHELERERLQQQNPGQEVEVDKQKTKFMISQEAPMLMTKACELLIKEVTVRAWQHTERNRRRTLQRADLHAAVGESEVFDFLIDIVPRVATAPPDPPPAAGAAAAAAVRQPAVMEHQQQHPAAMQFAAAGGMPPDGTAAAAALMGPAAADMQVMAQDPAFLTSFLQIQGPDGTDALTQHTQLLQQQQQQQQQQQSQSQDQAPQWTDPSLV